MKRITIWTCILLAGCGSDAVEKRNEPVAKTKVVSGKVLDQANPQHSYQILETREEAGKRQHVVLDRMMTGAKGRAMIMEVDGKGDGAVAIVRLDCANPEGLKLAGMREMKAFEEQAKPRFSRRILQRREDYQKIICRKDGKRTFNGDRTDLGKILLNAPMNALPDR